MIDQLITQIRAKRNPVCAGLDTRLEYVPAPMRPGEQGSESPLSYAARCIYEYNCRLMDAFVEIIPCVKVQSAYYEMYGPAGVEVFQKTIEYAHKLGMLTIADVKRNDIGSTAEAYAQAYIGRTDVDGDLAPVFDADFMTVNAYLGTDGIAPFLEACRKWDRGIFVLVRTSNPSAGELQDLVVPGGQRVYQSMMDRVAEWGRDLAGSSGFSDVGAVVGATYPVQAVLLREKHPGVFMLLPGAGAQGADITQLAGCFDTKARGAIINNSRQMLTAWQKEPGGKTAAPEAALRSLQQMQKTINTVFEQSGISYD